MRPVIFFWVLLLSGFGQAQNVLSPDNAEIDKKLIKEETYTMNWYMKRDTSSVFIGAVLTELRMKDDHILLKTTIERPGNTEKWVDSTLAKATDLSPVYHSSYNTQRDMVIHFGSNISGYYIDKLTKEKTTLGGGHYPACFDSNFYPQVIRWLPLKDGYTATLRIFDFNPKANTGIMNAYVESVVSTVFKKVKVWDVTVSDDIGGKDAKVHYFIDKKNRDLLGMRIDMDKAVMVMERVK